MSAVIIVVIYVPITLLFDAVDDLHDVVGNLLVLQMVVGEQLVYVIAVVEHLAHTEVEHAHGRRAIEAGYCLTIAAVDAAVLDSGDDSVVGLQVYSAIICISA